MVNMTKRLTVLVGPPGSGKSTLAKEYCAKGGVTYINQDSQGKGHLQLFEAAIAAGEDVVVDRMGFNKAQRDRYISLARKNGYYVHIVVLHQPYQVCFQRCLSRTGHETIKDEMNARAALDLFFTKYERPTPDEADKIDFVYPEGAKPSAIICDLDGTLANCIHRLHYVRKPQGQKKDWFGFFKAMGEDSIHQWCADILKSMSKDHTIVYCSGRPDSWREKTVGWLKRHDMFSLNDKTGMTENFHLYMRPRSDSRDDSIVKEIILDFEILTRFAPFFMIDDRNRVVEMWRKRGYTCLQCAPGDF